MTLVTNLSLIIFFYVIGSFPFALIFTKLFGFGDIRKIGSGNVGATNVLRTGNKFLAIIVLCFDIFKGFLPFLILQIYFQDISLFSKLLLCHFAILGHIYPFWLKFKGGKGVATYIGFLFGLNPYIATSFLLIWLVTAFISKYSSLGSLIGILVAPAYFIFINFNFYILIFFIYLTLIIYIQHIENIKRLINKTESKIKLSK
ncbi:glycerol-3-phosphate 1-O-acyltransferase PlsY [Pelagibacteraceae bacterium]|nr:glycerol-3-phosphate 1-O-acyltransferase PlsY [Pelagibacteraceae bacterium]